MIKGKKILLRALEPEDVDVLYEWENDHASWHLSNTLTPFSRFVLEQYVMNSHEDIHKTRQLRMMVESLSEEKPVGAVDLFEFEPVHQRVGLGLMIVKPERQKGYASEAIDLVTGYCFNTLMTRQVFCNITPDNKASLHLFQKKGFKITGRKKDWLRWNNQWHDELMLQLINPKK